MSMSVAKQNRKVVQVTIFFCFDQNIGPNVAKKAPICQEFDVKTVDEKKKLVEYNVFLTYLASQIIENA